MVAPVAMGGGALLSFGFGKKGGAAEIFENGVTTGEVGKLPLFPLLIKRVGADVSSFRIKKPPHDLSHDAAFNACRSGRARWIRSKIRCDPTALGTVSGPGPGAPVGVLE